MIASRFCHYMHRRDSHRNTHDVIMLMAKMRYTNTLILQWRVSRLNLQTIILLGMGKEKIERDKLKPCENCHPLSRNRNDDAKWKNGNTILKSALLQIGAEQTVLWVLSVERERGGKGFTVSPNLQFFNVIVMLSMELCSDITFFLSTVFLPQQNEKEHRTGAANIRASLCRNWLEFRMLRVK